MTAASAGPGGTARRAGGGFGALLGNELLKTRKRLAFWVTAGLFAVLNGGATVDAVRREMEDADRTFALPESWDSILGAPGDMGPYFLALLTILLVASEFQWRTARQNVIDGLSRDRFYAGKLAVMLGLVVLFFALPLALGAAGTLASPGENGPELVRETDLSYMAGYALSLLMLGSAGLMLATVIRSSGPAMGVLFAYMLVEQFLGFFLRRFDAIRDATGYFPLALRQTLTDGRFHYPERLAAFNANRAQNGQPPLEFMDHGVAVALALVYVAVFLAVAFVSMRKRDL